MTVVNAVTPVNLVTVQHIAEAASPGPWKHLGDGIMVGCRDEYLLDKAAIPGRFRRPVDGVFAATFNPATALALLEALWHARNALVEYSHDPAAQTMRDGRWLSSYGPYRANHALNRLDQIGLVFPRRREFDAGAVSGGADV